MLNDGLLCLLNDGTFKKAARVPAAAAGSSWGVRTSRTLMWDVVVRLFSFLSFSRFVELLI